MINAHHPVANLECDDIWKLSISRIVVGVDPYSWFVFWRSKSILWCFVGVAELYAFHEVEKIREKAQLELDKPITQDLQMSESQIHDATKWSLTDCKQGNRDIFLAK